MSKNNASRGDTHSSIWIVMPAYNAEATVKHTFGDISDALKGQVILVDDGSKDKTVEIAWRNSWISDVQLQLRAE